MMIQREILVSNDFVAKARSTAQSWIAGYSGGGDWSVGRRTGSTDGGLRVLPTDIALAFILIQHLDPKRRSILPDLLSRATKIPVHEALDAMKIESNHIYEMPSNVDISITDGHFGLTPRVMDHHKQNLPIDIFMRSLAEVRKSQAIGVILSGTASDGTAGVEAIRAAGLGDNSP